ncbi:hypothetical protein GLAREA_11954 [Glarea lozoyensis ATCC 20868]|uniref:AA1-like domain-containing protein n=1 Tax=Glarea lozoyensis (strain ATCC 20868 / MF5171) TaxID=1116229 RepID=S3D034_GLAL2|nr:uncharacterized protein GLAREA_11954 [Glarea lozoyensis ATCC 20868]EPE31872.1 hypothetical protein GLAREA_11954 [Glarea lozoyensis ATCC 20868]
MQFSKSLLIATTALLSTAVADSIFAITGTGTLSSTSTEVKLQVQNGNVGDAPKCSGGLTGRAGLPLSGNIFCADGYSLSFTWSDAAQGIAATYATPTSPAFTYNVPNLGCDASDPKTCNFGFTNIFPSKKMARRSFQA